MLLVICLEADSCPHPQFPAQEAGWRWPPRCLCSEGGREPLSAWIMRGLSCHPSCHPGDRVGAHLGTPPPPPTRCGGLTLIEALLPCLASKTS